VHVEKKELNVRSLLLLGKTESRFHIHTSRRDRHWITLQEEDLVLLWGGEAGRSQKLFLFCQFSFPRRTTAKTPGLQTYGGSIATVHSFLLEKIYSGKKGDDFRD